MKIFMSFTGIHLTNMCLFENTSKYCNKSHIYQNKTKVCIYMHIDR